MKKYLPFLIFIFFLVLAPKTSAQGYPATGTSTLTPRDKLLMQKEQANVKAQTRQEVNASKTAQLKTKLQAFKNQQKAGIIQKISDNLNKINANRTGQMLKNLDSMTVILNKISKNTADSSASATITSASVKITTAKDAVTNQTKKDYTVLVTLETKAKVDSKTMRDQLATDLQSTRKLVIDAKQAVADAIQTVKSQRGNN